VLCGYPSFCIPLTKTIHKKTKNKKEEKSFCKDVEEKLAVSSEAGGGGMSLNC
jgi:hypothetical protein